MTLSPPNLSDPAAGLYQKAIDAYYTGRFEIASAHVDEILAHTPEHAHAMHLGGLSRLALGDAEAAQRWVMRALEVAPEPNFYNTLYSIQFKLGEFDDASRVSDAAWRSGRTLRHSITTWRAPFTNWMRWTRQ